MGLNGLELLKTFPENLSNKTLNEITIKSMPFGAKDGDFTTTNIGDDLAISSYIFTYPGINRDNIASLIVVFESMEYKPDIIKDAFENIIQKLRFQKNSIIEMLMKFLPNIFQGIEKNFIRIQISSVSTIEIRFEDEDKKELKQSAVKSFKDDIWT